MNSKYYDELYDIEDKHWWHIAKRELVLSLIARYSNQKKLKILDVGCGTGKNIEEFNKFGNTYGIDNSRKAIIFCKKRGILNAFLCNSDKTFFKPKSFDLITALDLLEHTDDKKTISEIYRILKPKGLFILSVPAYSLLWSKWDEELGHKRRYNMKNLKTLLKTNGFSIIKSSYLFSFLVIPAYFVRKLKSKIFKNNYPSDFKLTSLLLNFLLLNLSRIEKFFFLNAKIPFGTSIICVAKKNEK